MTTIDTHFVLNEDASDAEKVVFKSISETVDQRGEQYTAGQYLSSSSNIIGWGELAGARLNSYNSSAEPDYATVPDFPHITLQVSTDTYEGLGKDRYDLGQQVADLLELIKFIYININDRVLFVSGLSGPHGDKIAMEDMPLPITEKSLVSNQIEYMSWLSIFPPPFVETYGEETLLSAPAWHAEKLDDGAVLLVAYENPSGAGSTKPIDDHLGLESPGLNDILY